MAPKRLSVLLTVPLGCAAHTLPGKGKSRNQGGKPKVDAEIHNLIRQIGLENPLWGAPRIHGELLKLGINVCQSTVARYMVRGLRPSGQTWKTFLKNHEDAIASLDFLVVPTISFRPLYCLVILDHERRKILWAGVTFHPTSEWVARQTTEAFPWDEAPGFLIRDNDGAFGLAYRRRLEAMGNRDRPTSPRSCAYQKPCPSPESKESWHDHPLRLVKLFKRRGILVST